MEDSDFKLLSRRLERLERASAPALAKLDEADRKRDEEVAERQADRERAAREATITFPGVPVAADDMVVMGRRREEHGFRLVHNPDGSLQHYPWQQSPPDLRDGEQRDGRICRVYRFDPRRTVHYVPAALIEGLPARLPSAYDPGARYQAPADLWKYVGGVERFLPFERAGQPNDDEIAKARREAMSSCRDLVDGCEHAALLRIWRANAHAAGDAASVLQAVIDRRLEALGADAERAEPDEPEAA